MGWCSVVSVGGALGQEQRRAAPQDLLPAANQGLGGPTCPCVWRDHPLLPGVSLQQIHTGNMALHVGVSWELWGVHPSTHCPRGAYSKKSYFFVGCNSALVVGFRTVPRNWLKDFCLLSAKQQPTDQESVLHCICLFGVESLSLNFFFVPYRKAVNTSWCCSPSTCWSSPWTTLDKTSFIRYSLCILLEGKFEIVDKLNTYVIIILFFCLYTAVFSKIIIIIDKSHCTLPAQLQTADRKKLTTSWWT